LSCATVVANERYELPLLPNGTAVKHFYTNRSSVKCWLDIYRWGAGPAVPGKYVTLDRTFYSLLLEKEAVATQLLPHFVAYRIPRGDLY
jgi:hypothetical protein